VKALVVAAALLMAGCSLPLPEGVHVSRGAATIDSDPGDIQVMPPGPQDGASPDSVVRGFLGAESSPEDSHAIARRFLTPKAKWVDSEVVVYDPATLVVEAPATASLAVVVSVTFKQLGSVDQEGRFSSAVPADVTETYPLVQDTQRQWRISDPPRGVRLTPADRDRSFPARRIYFLSKSSRTALHVVPDPVLLPVGGKPGVAEVSRLLRGPSSAIAGSVTSGFPPGTQLRSVTSSAGIYEVSLSPEVQLASDLQRQTLSAQLVWTLRSLDPRFRGLRVISGGEPLKVPGEGDVQQPDDWDLFDPDGLTAGPAYFTAGKKVQTLVGGTQRGGPAAVRDLLVDAVAVTPDRTRIAVLQPGVVRSGPMDGRGLATVSAPGVVSLSWGTGERGLWLLDNRGRVQLLDLQNKARPVPVPGVEGRITWLAVSRDGVRAAMVINGGVYVGRVRPIGEGLAIVGATQVAPELSRVTRLAWRDPTSLVVLGRVSQTFVPVVVAIDGSSVRPLPVSGLPAQAEQVAASPLGVVVTSAKRLFTLSSLGFRPGPLGAVPAYPG
jgi:hypothetical protein